MNDPTSTLDQMTYAATDPDMRDLMAAVGEVLLCWGYLESAILDRLTAIEGPSTKLSKSSPLSRWKTAKPTTPEIAEVLAEIDRLAQVRHCLAHGLEGASVNPADAHAPAVTCRTPAGQRQISYAILVETQRSLHRLTHVVRSLPFRP